MPPDGPAAPASFEPWVFSGSGKLPATGPAEPVATAEVTTISVKHWGRLGEGELFARARYVAWAVLKQRTFGKDALLCPRCESKMRVVATITDPATVRRILEHLGLQSAPISRAPARDPTWEQGDFRFDEPA
jgi:hypothetical protein